MPYPSFCCWLLVFLKLMCWSFNGIWRYHTSLIAWWELGRQCKYVHKSQKLQPPFCCWTLFFSSLMFWNFNGIWRYSSSLIAWWDLRLPMWVCEQISLRVLKVIAFMEQPSLCCWFFVLLKFYGVWRYSVAVRLDSCD